jgi:hypothetical protein
MNTEAAKKLAEERHTFMELYLQMFFKEINVAEASVDNAKNRVAEL